MRVLGAIEQFESNAECRHAIKLDNIKDLFFRKLRTSLSQLLTARESDKVGCDVLPIRLRVYKLDVVTNRLVSRPAHHFNRVSHVQR